MKFLVPVLAAVLFAAPVAAQDAKPQTAAAQEEAAEEDAQVDKTQNRMICKRQKSTGSRLAEKRVCMTAAQWHQLERDQREATERAQANRPRDN